MTDSNLDYPSALHLLRQIKVTDAGALSNIKQLAERIARAQFTQKEKPTLNVYLVNINDKIRRMGIGAGPTIEAIDRALNVIQVHRQRSPSRDGQNRPESGFVQQRAYG